MSSRLLAILSITAALLLGAVSYGCAQKRSTMASALPSAMSSDPVIFGEHQGVPILPAPASDNESGNPTPHQIETQSDSESLLPGLANLSNNKRYDPKVVRADIRHLLQNKFPNSQQYQTAINGAAILQTYLNDPQQNASDLLKQFDCATISLTQADQNLIKTLTFDTPERAQLLKAGLQDYQPPVSTEITIDSSGNAVSPCQS